MNGGGGAANATSWQAQHDACQRLHRDVWTLMSDRSNLPRTSHGYANLTERINATMKKYSSGLDRLKAELDREKTGPGLTSGEFARRHGLVSVLKSQQIQLRNVLSQSSAEAVKRAEEKRRQLLSQDGGGVAELGKAVGWGGGGGSGRSNAAAAATGYGYGSIEEDSMVGVRTNDQMLREQDEGLDNLHSIIVRQRTIAQTIEGEVGVQNEIIEGLGEDLERTNQNLLSTTQRVRAVTRTSAGVGKYWTIILILLVVIVILVAIPS